MSVYISLINILPILKTKYATNRTKKFQHDKRTIINIILDFSK
jgi:hypothetical protein